MNRIYPEAIRQIRVTNPNRTLFVGPGDWNGILELKLNSGGLVLPDDDKNLIAAVHCYDPYYFTHQGAEWALPDTATVGVIFPGPPAVPLNPHPSITHSWVKDWFRDYNNRSTALNPSSPFAFRSKMRGLQAWADYWGRPVHVGEFGCYEKAGSVSRVNFYREIRQAMDEHGLGWAMWDWKAGFHYMKNGRPDPPGMREAMFPPMELSVSASGAIEFDGAIAKTYIVQRRDSLTPPAVWQNVATQILSAPKFQHTPEAAERGGFYRVQWVK
jgi:endoglucanase